MRRCGLHNRYLLLLAVLVQSSCLHRVPTDTEESVSLPRVLVTYEQLFQDPVSGPSRVQDFDFAADTLLLHPVGPFGLYRYQRGVLQQLVSYPSGNYMSCDSHFVFYEVSGFAIFRYNLETDTTDLQFDLSALDHLNINGMDVYNGFLYVQLELQPPRYHTLARFTLDGRLVETIRYPRKTLHLTIADDIVFAIYAPEGENPRLSRFSLRARTFLPDADLPTPTWDGIRAYRDRLYFADYEKRYIASLPIADFRP